MDLDRRSLLIASSLIAAAGIAGCGKTGNRTDVGYPSLTDGHPPDPSETFVLPYDKISFEAWGNLLPTSGQMATLYGDLNKPRAVPGGDEMESRLVQCTAFLCNGSDLCRCFRNVVGEQRKRILTILGDGELAEH